MEGIATVRVARDFDDGGPGSGRDMHWARIVSEEQHAVLKDCGTFAETRPARKICGMLAESARELLAHAFFTRSSDKDHVGSMVYQPLHYLGESL
jgi:hypothetical protein